MAAASVHLADRVLPSAPVRQWVVSMPYELRLLLASNSQVLSAVIRIVMRVVLGWYRRRGRELGHGRTETGAVSFVQRSGGSLNAHTHIHSILIDGVYTRAPGAAPVFHFAAAPTKAEIGQLASVIGERVCKMLRRRGLLGDANHESNEPEVVDAALAACRKVALSRGRFERIDEHGRAQQELFADEVVVSRRRNDPWVGEHKGFTLHAGVRIGALDRTGRERLVRYCTRPPVAMERLSILRDGSVAYRLKYANKRRSHRVMQPLEFMARLASIVAPPRLPLTRYHGCLAPNSSWRRQIVAQAPARGDGYEPGPCPNLEAKRDRDEAERVCAPQSSSAPVDLRVVSNPELPKTESVQAAPPKPRSRTSTSYVPWAELMRRTLER